MPPTSPLERDADERETTLAIARTHVFDRWAKNYAVDVSALLAALQEAEERAERAERRNLLNPQASEYVAALEEERDRLREALIEAADDVESWGTYASDYFQEKWGLADDVARIRAAAADHREDA